MKETTPLRLLLGASILLVLATTVLNSTEWPWDRARRIKQYYVMELSSEFESWFFVGTYLGEYAGSDEADTNFVRVSVVDAVKMRGRGFAFRSGVSVAAAIETAGAPWKDGNSNAWRVHVVRSAQGWPETIEVPQREWSSFRLSDRDVVGVISKKYCRGQVSVEAWGGGATDGSK
ncbi:MAG: hypothetical protein PHR35_04285 [Kiritimatiellae bacterium]|nr:hypothetical protein [Kiritimatiellia bacterium]